MPIAISVGNIGKPLTLLTGDRLGGKMPRLSAVQMCQVSEYQTNLIRTAAFKPSTLSSILFLEIISTVAQERPFTSLFIVAYSPHCATTRVEKPDGFLISSMGRNLLSNPQQRARDTLRQRSQGSLRHVA